MAGVARRAESRSPHLAYGMRDTGEEKLRIITERGEDIGDINVDQAVRETPPGGRYRHGGREYLVKSWGRSPENRAGLVRVEETPMSRGDTRTMVRRLCLIEDTPESVPQNMRTGNRKGHVSLVDATLSISAEGLTVREDGEEKSYFYRQLMQHDPKLSRKGYEFPTTALWIELDEPWFTGDGEEARMNRELLAEGLTQMICYRRSVPPSDIKYMTGNVTSRSPSGYVRSPGSVLIYDNVYGGIGLSALLAEDLDEYAKAMASATVQGSIESQAAGAAALKFGVWLKGAERTPSLPERNCGAGAWHLALRTGCRVRTEDGDGRAVAGHAWKWKRKAYRLRGGEETETAAEDNLLFQRGTGDWVLWRPETDDTAELEME